MYSIAALIIGSLISIMLSFNGALELRVGTTYSLAIIHIIGLIAITIIILLKKCRIRIKEKIPFYLFLSGVVGVLLTLVNILTIKNIGVALTTALAVFGQLIFSSLVDHFGLFGLNKYKFNPKKIIGFCIVFFGLIIMTMA